MFWIYCPEVTYNLAKMLFPNKARRTKGQSQKEIWVIVIVEWMLTFQYSCIFGLETYLTGITQWLLCERLLNLLYVYVIRAVDRQRANFVTWRLKKLVRFILNHLLACVDRHANGSPLRRRLLTGRASCSAALWVDDYGLLHARSKPFSWIQACSSGAATESSAMSLPNRFRLSSRWNDACGIQLNIDFAGLVWCRQVYMRVAVK